MARRAGGAVFIDIAPAPLTVFRRELQAEFKTVKPFLVPIKGKWGGFAPGFQKDARDNARKRAFTVPVKASFGGFAKDFRKDLREAGKKLAESQVIKIKVGADTRDVDVQLEKAKQKVRETSKETGKETEKLADKFKNFQHLTGLVAPRLIAIGAAAPSAVLGITNLSAAMVPLIGAVGAAPALLGAGAVAMGTYKLATQGFGDAIGALMDGDGKKWEEYLAKLSPSARAAAQEIARMKPQLVGLQQAVQESFFRGIAEDLRLTGAVYLPLLRRGLPPVAASMSGFVENLSAGARQAPAMAGVNSVINATALSLAKANNNIGPLTSSVLALGTDGAPQVVRLGGAFESATGRLAGFIARSRESGAVTVWIDEAIDTGKVLVGVLGNVGSIVYSIFSAGNTTGGSFLVTLRDLTGTAATFLQSQQGAAGLQAFFSGLSAIGGSVGTVLGAVLPALGESFVILAPAVEQAAPAMAELLISAVPLVPALAGLATGVIPPLVDVLKVLIVPLEFVGKLLGVIFTWMGKNALVSAFVATIIAGVVAFKIFVGVVKVIAIVTRAWAAAQFLLNAAWAANPVGVIIVGIIALAAALVLAYRKSETFRNIVQTTFRAIAVAAVWLWDNVLKPIWDGLVWYFQNIVFPVWRFLYFNVVKPIFDFIIGYARFWWTAVSAVFTGVVWFLQNFVFPWWQRLYDVVIKPVFDAAGAVIKFWWNNIVQPVFGAVMWVINNILIPGFWFWWSVVKTVWGAVGSAIQWAWKNVIKPVFDFLSDAVMNKIPAAFRVGKDAVGRAWDQVKDIAKKPIKFVIETVINDGIIGAYNWVASKFGVKKADKVPLPNGFAAGGVLPGYTPGRDVHMFFSPTAGPLELSGGEAIMRPEFTRAVGPEVVFALNAAAREKGQRGVQLMLQSLFSAAGGDPGNPPSWRAVGAALSGRRSFALGGVFGGVGDFFKGAWDKIKSVADVGAWVRKAVNPLIEKIPGAAGIRDIAVAGSKKILGDLVDWATGKAGEFFKSGGGWSGFIPPDKAGRIKAAQDWARGAAGTPYRYGGHNPGGFDCSSAVSAVYNILQGKAPFGGVRFTTANESQYMNRPGPSWFYAKWISGNKGIAHTKGWVGGLPFEQTPPHFLVGRHATKDSYFNQTGHPAWAAANGGVYDEGGWLQPGHTMTYNGTGKPEAVLTDRQWKLLKANQKAGGDTIYDVDVHYPKDKPTRRAIRDELQRLDLVYGEA